MNRGIGVITVVLAHAPAGHTSAADVRHASEFAVPIFVAIFVEGFVGEAVIHHTVAVVVPQITLLRIPWEIALVVVVAIIVHSRIIFGRCACSQAARTTHAVAIPIEVPEKYGTWPHATHGHRGLRRPIVVPTAPPITIGGQNVRRKHYATRLLGCCPIH